MAQEIDLGGTIYISSKHAAEKTGYTQDYIGQLARGGQIEAKRVSGMWYILEQSLRDYKAKADLFVPTPPQGFTPSPNAEVSVSFDGKDYISTSRAAKLTGYNQDYVGQLARSGEVLSRQVGNRWYIDRESLMNHKKAKDDLLAAVQVESVGLAKPDQQPEPVAEIPSEIAINEEVTHFEYVKEEAPLIPDIAPILQEVLDEEPMPEFPRRKVAAPIFEEYRAPNTSPIAAEAPQPTLEPVQSAYTAEESSEEPEIEENTPAEVNIPIRVSEPYVEEQVYIEEDAPRKPRAKMGKGTTFAISGITVLAALGTIAYVGSTLGFLNFNSVISSIQGGQNAAVANSVVRNGSSDIQNTIRNLFSKEIVYTRE